MNNIKKAFPIFDYFKNNNNPLYYLDNGATTQKPSILMETENEYYTKTNSNIHRSVHKLSEESTKLYENTRTLVSEFIHCNEKEIIFTSGTTFSINFIAEGLKNKLQEGDIIILSIYEHHANILPWQKIAKEKKATILFIKDDEILNNPFLLENNINLINKIKIIAITHISNVTGLILPIKKWCDFANKHNILTVIDGAQGIGSELINIRELNCSFYVFSAHKIYGPTGVGIIFGKNHLLQKMEPLILGGGIIEDVTEEEYTLQESPYKFEAGTPNISGVITFGAVLKFLLDNDWNSLIKKNKILNLYLREQLLLIKEVSILKNDQNNNTTITSFNIHGIHSHDIGSYLSEKNIAVRVGQHCAMPLLSHLGINSTVRVSFGIYNSKKDIDKLVTEIKNAIHYFKVKV